MVKTKSAVTFTYLMQSWSILETARALCLSRSRFHLSSVGPCLKKKNTAKGKEVFQGKFVVIVEGFAR